MVWQFNGFLGGLQGIKELLAASFVHIIFCHQFRLKKFSIPAD
jgi:hypothetical protein